MSLLFSASIGLFIIPAVKIHLEFQITSIYENIINMIISAFLKESKPTTQTKRSFYR